MGLGGRRAVGFGDFAELRTGFGVGVVLGRCLPKRKRAFQKPACNPGRRHYWRIGAVVSPIGISGGEEINP